LKKEGRKTLMAIDDVNLLLDLLCSKNQYVGREGFRNELINLTGWQLKTKSKTDQMFLNTLTALNLLEKKKDKKITIYERTIVADELCEERNNSDKTSFRNILQSVVKESEYTKLFLGKLLKKIDEGMKDRMPVRTDELTSTKEFSDETMRTLKSLGIAAGLFEEIDGYLVKLESELKIPDIKKFKQEVFQVYERIIERRRKKGTYARTTYSKIEDVRRVVCALNKISFTKFNELFAKLLTSPEGRKIEVFGAAPQYLPDRNDPEFENFVFKHNGKIYVFMTI